MDSFFILHGAMEIKMVMLCGHANF